MFYILGSQLGSLFSEKLSLRYEPNLVLRRILIVSIICQIVIVATITYSVLLTFIAILGLSAGGDMNFINHSQHRRIDLLRFGLAWCLSSLVFGGIEIFLIQELNLSRKYMILGVFVASILLCLLKNDALTIRTGISKESVLLVRTNSGLNEYGDIVVPLIEVPEENEEDNENEQQQGERKESFQQEKLSLVVIGLRTIAVCLLQMALIGIIFVVPTFRNEYVGIVSTWIAGILGVVTSCFITEKKYSSATAFFIIGVWYSLAWGLHLHGWYTFIPNYFFFAGMVNFNHFMLDLFEREDRKEYFTKINRIAGLLSMGSPIFVHLVYIEFGALTNLLIIGSMCISLAFTILLIKNN